MSQEYIAPENDYSKDPVMQARGEALEKYLMGDVPPPDDDETSRPSPFRKQPTHEDSPEEGADN